MAFTIGDGNNAKPKPGQGVFRAGFGYCNIERVACFLFEAVGYTAFGLQVVIAVQTELDSKHAYEHGHVIFPWLQRCRFFHSFEGFYEVAFLDVVEVFQANATFVAFHNFPCIILVALEGSDLSCIDNHAIAQKAHAGIAGNFAIHDV